MICCCNKLHGNQRHDHGDSIPHLHSGWLSVMVIVSRCSLEFTNPCSNHHMLLGIVSACFFFSLLCHGSRLHFEVAFPQSPLFGLCGCF